MACLTVVLVLSTLMVYTWAQALPGTCDTVGRLCINGICELKANQQMGCTCNRGFVADLINQLICNPIDTPALPTCNTQPGALGTQCVNGMCRLMPSGVYGCVCMPGYQPGINPNICEDIDDCQITAGFNGCAMGSCVNLPGNYICRSCAAGYTLDQFNKCRITSSVNQNTQGINPWLWAWLLD